MKLTIQEVIDCTTWKTCSVCNEEKKTVMFSKRGKNGFKGWCKACDHNKYLLRKQSRPTVTEEKKSLIQRLYSWIVK